LRAFSPVIASRSPERSEGAAKQSRKEETDQSLLRNFVPPHHKTATAYHHSIERVQFIAKLFPDMIK